MCITNRREPLGGWASAGHLAMIPPLAIYDKAMKKLLGACSLVIEFRIWDLFFFCFAPPVFQNLWLCLWSFDFCQVYMGAERGMHRAAGVGVAGFVFNLEHERDTRFSIHGAPFRSIILPTAIRCGVSWICPSLQLRFSAWSVACMSYFVVLQMAGVSSMNILCRWGFHHLVVHIPTLR